MIDMATKQNKQTDGFSVVKKPSVKRITAANSKSIGTTVEMLDWKSKELKTFLSQGEMKAYCILRWQDEVINIETQYPLDNDLIDRVIARLSDTEHGKTDITEIINSTTTIEDKRTPYTTDLFATLKNGTYKAFQVKPNPDTIARNVKVARRLLIEKEYFRMLNIPWAILYSDDINIDYFLNIKTAVRYYNPKDCHDDISKFQCLVSHKIVKIEMKTGIVDWKGETEKYLKAHRGKISLKGVKADD